jgi:uncharacterized cupredoxin-like copper-binding protein
MNRLIHAAAAVAVVLTLAACAPAAAKPNWTYTPVGEAGSGATPLPATPPPATPPPATPPPATVTDAVLGTEAAPREIDLTMDNFLFDPGSITVHQGETIRFVVTNPTTIRHELVLGDAEEQEHHAMEMDEMSSEGSGHMMAEPNELEVEAGTSGELVWTFDAAGEFLMGCHVAGHWEAGMRGAIEVVP